MPVVATLHTPGAVTALICPPWGGGGCAYGYHPERAQRHYLAHPWGAGGLSLCLSPHPGVGRGALGGTYGSCPAPSHCRFGPGRLCSPAASGPPPSARASRTPAAAGGR